jgi:Zn finger protein HypA/HybF involved in hydrogenase expression
MPDGAAIRCKDCHHTLPAAEPGEPFPDMRCTLCHVPLGAPEKEVGGKKARSLATLKPDGAIDIRSVLFHDQCRGCHLKIKTETLNLATCKVCHPGGLKADAIHGKYDAR